KDASSTTTQFLMSFANVTPIAINNTAANVAGADLTVDASSTPATSQMTISDDATPGDGYSQVSGDGGISTTTFNGFQTLTVRGGTGSETLQLKGLDSATQLTSVSMDGDNIFNTDTADDTLMVNSLPAGVTATLRGGQGNDKFQIWNTGVPTSNL